MNRLKRLNPIPTPIPDLILINWYMIVNQIGLLYLRDLKRILSLVKTSRDGNRFWNKTFINPGGGEVSLSIIEPGENSFMPSG